MELREIFAKRLRNARIMKGWSMDDLCKAMDNSVSKMSISKYENGKVAPNSDIVISLSKALDLPVDYFLRLYNFEITSIKLRNNNLGIKKENSIKELIIDYLERYLEIENICNSTLNFTSPFSDVVSSREEVINYAQQLRKDWKLGLYGIVNVLNLLEEKGIKVLEIEAQEDFDCLSSIINNVYPVVVLNKKLNAEQKRFTAFRELGHLLFNFSKDIEEKEEDKLCNIFANEMLIPQQVFIDLIGSKRHDISYQELKAIQLQYGISVPDLMNKARDFHIISEQHYKHFSMELKANPLFNTSLFPNVSSHRFNALVYKALSKDMITNSKADSLLNVSLEEVKKNLVLV